MEDITDAVFKRTKTAMQFIDMETQIINKQKTILKFKELLCVIYWEANYLYGCIMSPKLFADSFE